MDNTCVAHAQVEELHDEMKRKETRWSSNTRRMRDRVEALEQENNELKVEVKLLEKRRLEAWQQRDLSATQQPSRDRDLTAGARQVGVANDVGVNSRDMGGATGIGGSSLAPEATRQHFVRVSLISIF